MTLPSILYALASVPMFASRPFLAAFVTASIARFGEHVPFIGSSEVVHALAHSPDWFQSNAMLALLFALAALEVYSVKHAEVRHALEQIDSLVKSTVAALVSLAILDRDTATTIERIQGGGLAFANVWVGVIAISTWIVASLRRGLLQHVADVDDSDDIGLQSLLNWVENAWTVLGLLFLVVFPLAALVLSVLTALAIFGLKRRAEQKELASRVACAQCATLVLPHALACPTCRTPLPAPRNVTVFGTPGRTPSEDLGTQGFLLAARKRCPLCATRLRKRQVRQECPACRTITFATQADFNAYLSALDRRLPKALLVCLVFSAIPLVGVIPGVVYYRLTLVSGLRGYVPPLRGCLMRMLVRLVHWGLIMFQPIPLVGALILPLMCLTTFTIYRRALTGRAEDELEVPAAVKGLPA